MQLLVLVGLLACDVPTSNADLTAIHDGTPGCLNAACHPAMTAGGTVFTDLDGRQTVADATLTVTTAAGTTYPVATSGPTGLLYTESPLPLGVVTFDFADVGSDIHTLPDQASCNDCHVPGGREEAPGTLTASDVFPPTVLAIAPESEATGVSPATAITVTLSEPIDASSADTTTVRLTGPDGPESGTVVAVPGTTVVVFQPDTPLADDTSYTAIVEAGLTDEAGNPLAYQATSRFTTAGPGVPRLVASDPAAGTLGVDVDTTARLWFEPALDPTTVDPTTVSMDCADTGVEITVEGDGAIAVRPLLPLAEGDACTVRVDGVATPDGVAQDAAVEVLFATVPDGTAPSPIAAVPGAGRHGVPVDSAVQVLFDEDLDPSTLSSDALQLTADGVPVAGTVRLQGGLLTFVADGDLPADAVITATVAPGLADQAGHGVIAPGPWSFATATSTDGQPPAVVGTDPEDGSLDVPSDAPVLVALTEDPDLGTLHGAVLVAVDGDATVPTHPVYDPGRLSLEIRPLVALPDGDYVLQIGSPLADLAGNTIEPTEVGFSVAGTVGGGPPSFEGVTWAARSDPTTLTIRWEAATDDDPAASLQYNAYLSDVSGGHDFATPSVSSAPGADQVSVAVPDDTTDWYVVVRAVDTDGLEDTNASEVIAGRWTTFTDVHPIWLNCDCHVANENSDLDTTSWDTILLETPPGTVVPYDAAASYLATRGLHASGRSGWYDDAEQLMVISWIDQGALDN